MLKQYKEMDRFVNYLALASSNTEAVLISMQVAH